MGSTGYLNGHEDLCVFNRYSIHHARVSDLFGYFFYDRLYFTLIVGFYCFCLFSWLCYDRSFSFETSSLGFFVVVTFYNISLFKIGYSSNYCCLVDLLVCGIYCCNYTKFSLNTVNNKLLLCFGYLLL